MNSVIIVLVGLTAIALMLSAILAIAWHSFGRPLHALIWAVAFAIAAAQWVFNIILLRWLPGNPWVGGFVGGLAMMKFALLALGFRHRVGSPDRSRWLFGAVAGGSLAALFVALRSPDLAGVGVVPLLFGTVTLGLCARTLNLPGGRPNAAELCVMAMLLVFAMLQLGVGALALSQVIDPRPEYVEMGRIALMLVLPAVFTGIGLFAVFLLAVDLADEMRRLAASDPLTGIFNRRGFDAAAEKAIASARRFGQPLSLVIGDIDRFKAINDEHGHSAGDMALRAFADRVSRAIRRADLLGRIGGEEFALLLVGTDGREAIEIVERIRRDVEEMSLDLPHAIRLTASFGVVDLNGDETLAELLDRADRALYRSKLDGRNRVTFADPPLLAPLSLAS